MYGSEPRFEYDMAQRARAINTATLRACVSLYLIYLRYQVIRNGIDGETTMSLPLCFFFGALLIAAAAGFGVYIIKRYRKDLQSARIELREPESAEEEAAER